MATSENKIVLELESIIATLECDELRLKKWEDIKSIKQKVEALQLNDYELEMMRSKCKIKIRVDRINVIEDKVQDVIRELRKNKFQFVQALEAARSSKETDENQMEFVNVFWENYHMQMQDLFQFIKS